MSLVIRHDRDFKNDEARWQSSVGLAFEKGAGVTDNIKSWVCVIESGLNNLNIQEGVAKYITSITSLEQRFAILLIFCH